MDETWREIALKKLRFRELALCTLNKKLMRTTKTFAVT